MTNTRHTQPMLSIVASETKMVDDVASVNFHSRQQRSLSNFVRYDGLVRAKRIASVCVRMYVCVCVSASTRLLWCVHVYVRHAHIRASKRKKTSHSKRLVLPTFNTKHQVGLFGVCPKSN